MSDIMKDLNSANVELIEIKARRLEKLREEARVLEQEIKGDLTLLDRTAFKGKTWYEFMRSINEEITVHDNFTIKRESYRIYANYQINEDVHMSVTGNIYYNDDRFSTSLYYKESERHVDSLPKKYQKYYDEIVAEIVKYQVERPSDRISKQYGISHF